jgi:outer membrane protein OmpA-like peptidoglycan-associated protein
LLDHPPVTPRACPRGSDTDPDLAMTRSTPATLAVHPAVLLALALAVPPPAAIADTDCPGQVYGKGRRAICLPHGPASFADEVASFAPSARPGQGEWNDPAYALGEPDFTRPSAPGFVSLGCDGELVLRFVDNLLVDVEGPDLYVFEVGPMVEATDLAISADGEQWLDVGRIEGARSAVDIAGIAQPDTGYAWVRLVNAGTACGGRTPGADIDAVAAVGSALRLSLDSAVLFDVGQAQLKPAAHAELDALAVRLAGFGAGGRIVVEGHTDAVGSDAANLALSQARAGAVRDYLATKAGLAADRFTTIGHGEQRPVAGNDDEAGRARNRRVDIVVRPGS